jgi:hypothetical protein
LKFGCFHRDASNCGRSALESLPFFRSVCHHGLKEFNFVEHSTSIIVPVHNVEHLLRERITALMEILSDLTSSFQIRIVDDGSTDATLEIASELSTEYPQVSVSHRAKRRGLRAATTEEVAASDATIIILHDIHEAIGASAFREMYLNHWAGRSKSTSANSPAGAQPTAERIDMSHQAGSFRLVARRNRPVKPESTDRSKSPHWLEMSPDAIDQVPYSVT